MINRHPAGKRPGFPWEWAIHWQYVFALSLIVSSFGVHFLLDGWLGDRFPYIITVGALLPLVQLVRPGPFIVAALLGWQGSIYLFVEPRFSFAIASPDVFTSSLLFGGICLLGGLTALLAHRNRDRRERDRVALAHAEEARSHLVAIIESSDDAIISKQLDGTITSWNPGAERLFGYMAEETVGHPITMLLPPERLDEEAEIQSKLKAGQRVQHYDTIRVRKDGSLVDVSLTVSPVRDAQGHVTGASTIARDITQRKLAEDALKEADRRKDEFLATLAHELRNPLAAISLAMHVLDTAGDNPKQVGEMAALIQRQSLQLKRLIDDLMDVGRISRGKIKLEQKPFDIVGIIRQAVDDSQEIYDENGVNLSARLPEEQLIIEGDSIRFRQVLGNLLHNAAKFTERGGDVRISAVSDDHEAVVRVTDSGVGIPPDQLERVFEMFTQVEDDTSSMRAGGLGIGLSLAKSIVERLGGTIEACSKGRGQGSEFIIRMPLLNQVVVEPQVKSSVRQAVVPQLIVAADDNPDALKAVALTLRMRGHRVHTARDGLEALEVVKEQRPKIVLLDIGMPGMNGYEVARCIRRESWGEDVLLIATTGWGQEKDKAEAAQAGFDIHLTKPVDLNSLEEMFVAGRPADKSNKSSGISGAH